MTNKGATVKLTEKQREIIDRLAARHDQGYVELTFVRPNTWRSLVAAGLVSEHLDHVTMKYKLTAPDGYAAAGIKATYVTLFPDAESAARVEHGRRGSDEHSGPLGRPKTPDELAEDRRGLDRMFEAARQQSTDPVVREFYGVDDLRPGQHDASCADGCTHQHGPTGRVVTMTLTEYIASVAATVSAVRRAAMGAGL